MATNSQNAIGTPPNDRNSLQIATHVTNGNFREEDDMALPCMTELNNIDFTCGGTMRPDFSHVNLSNKIGQT